MSLNALFPLVPRSKCSKCACTSTVFGLVSSLYHIWIINLLTCRIRSTFHLVQPPLMRSRPVLGVITSTGTTTLFSLLILKRPTR